MTDPTIDRQALRDARADFEAIRLLLVSDLNEPGRSAFWKAVGARTRIDELLAALPPTTDGVRVTTDDEPYLWEGYWPGAGSIDSVTRHTRHKPTADKWIAEGVDVTPLYTARIMASLNIREVEPVAWAEALIRDLQIAGVRLKHAHEAMDIYEAEQNFKTVVTRVTSALASPTTAPEGVRDDALSDEDKRLIGNIRWKSIDRDNMEYSATISTYQLEALDRLLAALKGNRT